MNKPLILDIKGNSLDDGPGIRSVIFMKGCPLSCLWCHNPESKSKNPEISFEADKCIGCNACIDTCPKKAIAKSNLFYINRTICNLCFKCTDICPSNALTRVGEKIAIDELLAQLIKYKNFFTTSGGGVTISGGEPTLYMDFLSELLIAIKKEGIHTLIETCGQFDLDKFKKKIYPYVDMIFYDIKIINDGDHKKYCGITGENIRKNFTELFKLYQKGGVEVLPRTPLIPEITATTANMNDIVDFYKSNNVKHAALLPYHPLWRDKNKQIGIENDRLKHKKKLSSFLDEKKINECKAIFQNAGIKV